MPTNKRPVKSLPAQTAKARQSDQKKVAKRQNQDRAQDKTRHDGLVPEARDRQRWGNGR